MAFKPCTPLTEKEAVVSMQKLPPLPEHRGVAMNPYYLSTLEDFYRLHSEIQEYLKAYYLEPDVQVLIKATARETIEALVKDWAEVEEVCLREDQERGFEHEALSPPVAAEETVTGILKLWNSVLAILFRADWGPYQEALFGSWIPIGVKRPDLLEQDIIRVLNWPADCFEKETYSCTTGSLKVLASGLTLCEESEEYVLFWKPESSPVLPLEELVQFDINDHTDCTLNLWEDDQIKNLLTPGQE